MQKRKPKRPRSRNPVARALKVLKPKVVPSAKRYRRRSRHERPPETDNGNPR